MALCRHELECGLSEGRDRWRHWLCCPAWRIELNLPQPPSITFNITTTVSNPDGYDTEGIGYWNYGFSHFIELRENLMRATKSKIDLLASRKMQKVALFGLEFPMMPGNAAAFGDAGVMPKADAHLIQMIDHIFQISRTSAVSQEHSSGIQHAGLTSIALDLFPVPGDELGTPPEVSHHDLPDLLCRFRSTGLSAGGGAGPRSDNQSRWKHHSQP